MKANLRHDPRKLRVVISSNIIIAQHPKAVARNSQRWLRRQKNLFYLQQFGQTTPPILSKSSTFSFLPVRDFLKVKHKAAQFWKIFYGKIKSRPLFNIIKKRNRHYKIRCRLSQRQSLQFIHYINPFLEFSIKKNLSHTSAITIIERRLKVAIWRSFAVITIETRRQLISHGHVKVNNFTIKKPSYLLCSGDKVQLAIGLITHIILTQVLNRPVIWKSLSFRSPAAHLEVRLNTAHFVFNYYPRTWEMSTPVPINTNAMIAFYQYQ